MTRRRAAAAAVALAVLAATAAAAMAAARYEPSDPLVARQWYLQAVRAFDAWPELPAVSPVRVAIVDSGIDLRHPDLAGKVVAARSFVGGTPQDTEGHGTFVAGIVAAAIDNGEGIAGIAFPAELVIAKVVDEEGSISPQAEASAIRWAVDQGARVVNLSLGGTRNPHSLALDSYSEPEHRAIEYARSKGVVVVAAAGNGDQAPSIPWRYASYPAALPHVIGVGAVARDGSVPAYSNRDVRYLDLAAPGSGIFSTLPRALTRKRPGCALQGYSDCGPEDFRDAEGTSYAAPQVAAAAAVLLALRPDLAPDQVTRLLQLAATDMRPATGCRACAPLRDRLSGWGLLDVAGAVELLAAPLPPRDRREPNDDAGDRAAAVYGPVQRIDATVDWWDDPRDVYRVRLRRGQAISVALRGPAGTETNLALWRPGTAHVPGRGAERQSTRVGPNEYLGYRAPVAGWYYVEVELARPGAGPYRLRFVKSSSG